MRKIVVVCLGVYIASHTMLMGGFGAGGIVEVPLPPPNQPEPVPLSGGVEINPIDIEGDIPPAELARLKQFPPFSGLTDEEVRAKMNIMRRNVVRAIGLIAYENPDLSYCLSRLWHGRRLCIGFTNRQIGGITNGNSFPNTTDRCERAAITIVVDKVPCDPSGAYEGDMIVLANTLAHEALHVTQDWSGVIPQRPPANAAEVDLRIQIQQNELAASEAEKKRLLNLNQVFTRLSVGGEVPEDDPRRGFAKLPMTLRALELFLREVPENMREDVADSIEEKTRLAYQKACQTADCRRAVIMALETLKRTGNGNDFVAALRGNRDAAGWVQVLGRQILTGVFQTDIIAGGFGTDANRIREFRDGEEYEHFLPADFLTDMFATNDRGFVVSTANEGADTGTIYLVGDSNGDGRLDTMMPTLTHEYLAGGVTFSPGPNGSLYCFAPQNQMLFQLQLGSDGTFSYPTGISFAGVVGSPATSTITRVLVSEDGLSAIGISDNDFANHLGTRWVLLSRGSLNDPFFVSDDDYSPVEDLVMAPEIVRWPLAGDTTVRVSGTAGATVTVEIVNANGGVMVSVAGTLGSDGIAEIGLGMALTSDYGVRVREGDGIASRSLMTAGDQDLAIDASLNCGQLRLTAMGPTHRIRQYVLQEDMSGSTSGLATLQTDGYGRTLFNDPFSYPESAVNRTGGLFRVRESAPAATDLMGESMAVPPGVPTRVYLNGNDRFPYRSRYELTDWFGDILPAQLFRFDRAGMLEVIPLSGDTTYTVTYGVGPIGGSIVSSATATLTVDESLLSNPPAAYADVPGLGRTMGFNVWSLAIGETGEGDARLYPLYQFDLEFESASECPEAFWTSTGLVYAINDAGAGGLANPDSDGCGYGPRTLLVPMLHFVPEADWNAFKQSYPGN